VFLDVQRRLDSLTALPLDDRAQFHERYGVPRLR